MSEQAKTPRGRRRPRLPVPPPSSFRDWFSEALARLDITAAELARRANAAAGDPVTSMGNPKIGRRLTSEWVRGHRLPPKKYLGYLAEALKLPPGSQDERDMYRLAGAPLQRPAAVALSA